MTPDDTPEAFIGATPPAPSALPAAAPTGYAATPGATTAPAEEGPETKRPTLKTDPKTLADAANEAAKREAAIWFLFVTLL
jgi:hypothetical protein